MLDPLWNSIAAPRHVLICADKDQLGGGRAQLKVEFRLNA
jgi:hypothetical protein